ncbi:hypothetical protein BH24DEI2_BH24DEI2_24490 [soil metagenome]
MLDSERETLLAALLTYRTTVESSACYRPLVDVKVELKRVDALLKRFGTDLSEDDPPKFTVPDVLQDVFERCRKSIIYSAQRDYARHEVAGKARDFASTCRHYRLSLEDAKACLIELELASEVSLPPYSELLTCYETTT